jgi:predicted LPLAT superfamily acyltransferase
MKGYKICALIPTYNHYQNLEKMIQILKSAGLAVFIVDDGNQEEAQEALQSLSQKDPSLSLLRLPVNKGKGAAVQVGLRLLRDKGYTHAFQVDADGQHSLEKMDHFLELSRRNPHALVSGQPLYDNSIPLSRRIGRWFTHVWIWVETLSLRITDSMCGFRIYPIPATLSIIETVPIGLRMDFDVEIMVRLHWQGTPVIMNPVQVSYPEGNLSNFDVFWDNWRITKMHTRLVISMLCHLPSILLKKPDYKSLDLPTTEVDWASLRERGSTLGLFFLATCYRLLGRKICRLIGAPLVLYFYLSGTHQRRASHTFLKRVFAYKDPSKKLGFRDGFCHFMHFFEMTLDKFGAWTGSVHSPPLEEESLESFRKIMASEKGGMLLVSHLGNMDFCRAISCSAHKKRLHVLLHTKNAERFNRMLRTFNPDAHVNIVEVTEIGPDTILYLKSRVELGEWIVIAADRIPIKESTRLSYVSFLGKEAPFSQGPYILASLLQCPVYTAFAVREGKKIRVFIDPFAEQVAISKKYREEKLKYFSNRYAEILAHYCIRYPYQWFNFFDFWAENL